MWCGNPKSKTSNVVVGGSEDNEIRSRYEVLYVSNLTGSSENKEEKYDVAYCDEKNLALYVSSVHLNIYVLLVRVPKLRG